MQTLYRYSFVCLPIVTAKVLFPIDYCMLDTSMSTV